MKDGHYSRPVWADDSWLAKYAGKTLDEGNVGEHGEVSAEHHGNIATIGKLFFSFLFRKKRLRFVVITKTAQISYSFNFNQNKAETGLE